MRFSLLDGTLDLDLVLGRNLSDEHATWFTAGFATQF